MLSAAKHLKFYYVIASDPPIVPKRSNLDLIC